MKGNIAILVSGNGTNMENIIRYFHDKKADVVKWVLTDREDAYALERARRWGVPCACFPKADWRSGLEVLEFLRRQAVDLIVLAGFLTKIPDCLLHAYPESIINLHPSLLPKYGGKGMYGMRVHQAVLAAGEKESGITIHYVNDRYDEGDIIFQTSCPVLPDDTPELLAARIHELEYKHYPKVIEAICIADILS